MMGLGTQGLVLLGILALPFLVGCVVAVLNSTGNLGPKHGTKRDRNDDDMDE